MTFQFLHSLLIHTKILSNILSGIYIKYLVFSFFISYLSKNNQIYVLERNLIIGSKLLYFLFKLFLQNIILSVHLPVKYCSVDKKSEILKITFTLSSSVIQDLGASFCHEKVIFFLFVSHDLL